MSSTIVQTWQRLLQFDRRPWVVFENGTCVVLEEPAEDVEARARAILANWQPSGTETAPSEMHVVAPYEMPGCVVRAHDPHVLAYIGFTECGGPDTSTHQIGMLGRAKIEQDARALKIIHVELWPPNA
jgi:hypothetical protein